MKLAASFLLQGKSATALITPHIYIGFCCCFRLISGCYLFYDDCDQTRRLYEEAAARKAKQQDLATRPPEDCSFRPTLATQRSSFGGGRDSPSRGRESGGGSSSVGRGRGRPDTPTRLYESAKRHNAKLEDMRRKVEEERLGRNW